MYDNIVQLSTFSRCSVNINTICTCYVYMFIIKEELYMLPLN